MSVAVLEGHTDIVRSVAFSPDGSLLASGSGDTMVRLWDVKTGEMLKVIKGHMREVYSVAFSPDGSLLASGSGDNTIRTWDPKSGKIIKIITASQWGVASVAFSPDGSLLASGSFDNRVRTWDLKSGVLQKEFNGRYPVMFSPDGATLALMAPFPDNVVCILDVKTGEVRMRLTHLAGLISFDFSREGSMIAASAGDKTVQLFDAKTGKVLSVLKGGGGVFSRNGLIIATVSSEDSIVRLWDVKSSKAIHILKGHTNYVYSIAFSPDGSLLASASGDKTIRLWDIKSILRDDDVPSVTAALSTAHIAPKAAHPQLPITGPLPPVPVLPSNKKFHVFLGHNWGEAPAYANHHHVLALSKELQAHGLSVWIDGERLTGNILAQISKGVEQSACFVVCVTRTYMEKVQAGGEDHAHNDWCEHEFTYAHDVLGKAKMIPVVTEAAVLNSKEWLGPVRMILGGMLYVDASNSDKIGLAAKEICSRVSNMI